mmetsp:Transcript_26591/g.39512  ORF Transcript_26591/g.39512 Transcript_26591/m.39512 type:complete len:179 (+) Transcript_26591:82-618(+)|eukprot:CAMPEP_0185035834 /NCGR_PEP_ID=MMETSP1103-20130426/27862_1 /TAXON_ID=36769 /ORGANISM="Paraphysomonas bandaiensis, Strain Caron Lab Isolate" /LENGTH=178 /DNA_ID=CAMNT_0027573097 /DNA_START=16 /DNA_END=552 /DNA_ORIENTATION=-
MSQDSKKTKKGAPKRKTLVQLQSETTVRDPAAHAKNQITELDKTAQRSLAKRKSCTEQVEADSKELAHVESQIQSIRRRYDALCKHLAETKEKRELVIKTLESCVAEEKSIMGSTQSIVHTRRVDDAKLSRAMATSTLVQARGFGVGPDTTFHQTRGKTSNLDGSLPRLKSTSKSKTR